MTQVLKKLHPLRANWITRYKTQNIVHLLFIDKVEEIFGTTYLILY